MVAGSSGGRPLRQLPPEATLDDGGQATSAHFGTCLTEEMERVKGEIGADTYAKGRFPEAVDLFRKMSTGDTLFAYLTLSAVA